MCQYGVFQGNQEETLSIVNSFVIWEVKIIKFYIFLEVEIFINETFNTSYHSLIVSKKNTFLFLDYILLWFRPLLEAVSFLSILNMNMNDNHLQIFSRASYHVSQFTTTL